MSNCCIPGCSWTFSKAKKSSTTRSFFRIMRPEFAKSEPEKTHRESLRSFILSLQDAKHQDDSIMHQLHKESASICDVHFDEEDIITKNRRKDLRLGALPKLHLPSSIKGLKSARICLINCEPSSGMAPQASTRDEDRFADITQNLSGEFYDADSDMLSILSSVANSEKKRQDRQAKQLQKMTRSSSRLARRTKVYSPSSSSSTSSNNEEDDDSEEESSELDEEDSRRIRSQCLDEMSTIERQFTSVRDRLYKERQSQITRKLKKVKSEAGPEYLDPFNALQQSQKSRIEVCERLREQRKSSIACLYQSQTEANAQHFENEKSIMADDIRDDILEKIRILEEDRDNVEFSTELWTDTELGNAQKSHPMHGGPISNSRRKGHGKKSKTQGQFDFGYVNGNGNKRKRKPVTVSGPYIVYKLKEDDIVDDWTVIKRALTATKRRESGHSDYVSKLRHTCNIRDGKLTYNGRIYQRGQSITMKEKDMCNTHATITSIGLNDITVRQSNSTLVKINSHELVKGRYSIRPR